MSYERTLRTYLGQCRVAQSHQYEAQGDTVPPSADEVQELVTYLRERNLDPLITGSAAVLKHLGPDIDSRRDFRPTKDLDIFVKGKLPQAPPPGWTQDRSAIGVVSWLSPSGGSVDFLEAGHEFPSGVKMPRRLSPDSETHGTSYPVVGFEDLVKTKLDSDRPKDLTDLLLLIKQRGIPEHLGGLNRRQKDNLDLAQKWLSFNS